MVPAYNGSEPYIFVSYAHKDSAEVYSTIEKLTSLGYRIWYDEGIKPGVEWPENIAEHLDKCSLFLMFISPNSMDSANCRREINFALSRSKKFLCIVLKKTEIPLGMELQLASQQSIFRYKYSSEEAYIYKICSAAGMSQCKDIHFFADEAEAVPEAAGTPAAAPVPAPVRHPETKKKTGTQNKSVRKKKASGSSNSGKNDGGAVFIGILIGAIIIFAFTFYLLTSSDMLGGNSNAALTQTPVPTATVTPSPTPAETPTITPTPVITQQTQIAGDTTGNTTQTGGNTEGTSGGTSGSGSASNGNTGDVGNTEDYNEVDLPDDGGNEEPYGTEDDGENTADAGDTLNTARGQGYTTAEF